MHYAALVAAFVVFSLGLAGAAFGYLINLLLIALISTYYVLRDVGMTLPCFAELKAYVKHGLPLMPTSVSTWTLSVSDQYVITFFLSVAWSVTVPQFTTWLADGQCR
jgi:O-antigen/teichoic acid export membrane protein